MQEVMETNFRPGNHVHHHHHYEQLVSGVGPPIHLNQSMMRNTRRDLLLGHAFPGPSPGLHPPGPSSSNDQRNSANGVKRPSTAKNATGRNGCRHTKRSPSERRFKCDQIGCDRMFFTRKDVKRHMVVHTGVRNFPCPYCQQRFGRKDHLVRHAKKSHNRDTRTSALNSYAAAAAASSTSSSSSTSSLHHHHPPFLPPPIPSSSSPANIKGMRSGPSIPQASNGNACASSPHDHSSPSSSLLLLNSGHHGSNGNGSSYHHSSPHHHQGVMADAYAASSMMAHHHHSLAHHQQADQLHHSQSHAQVPSHHHHHMVKSESSGANTGPPPPAYFSFPVASTPPFVSHSLMANPFVPTSPRTLYSSPGPSAFSVSVPGMSSLVVGGDHGVGPPPPSAMTAAFTLPGENPQLPHFSQAFQ